MNEQENIEEVKKEKVIGQFKSDKLIEFVATKGMINYITNEAFIDGKQLSGLDLDGIVFKLTICDEGTVNFDEVDTHYTTPEQRQRLLEVISDKTVTPYYTSRPVINELTFRSVQLVKGNQIDLYLCVEYKTPISILAELLEEEDVQVTDAQQSKLDALWDLFDEEVDEEAPVVAEVVKVDVSETFDSKKMMEESFKKMKQEKIDELSREITHQSSELKKFEYEKAQTETKIERAKEEIRLAESRLDKIKPAEEPNGYLFFVSEQLNEKTTLDEATAKLILSKISKVKSINAQAFMKLFDQGEYNIKLGTLVDGVPVEADLNDLPVDIKTALISMGITKTVSSTKVGDAVIEDIGLTYIGELTWHDIVGALIKKGFEQNPDFDKMCGSNSYMKDEDKYNPANAVAPTCCGSNTCEHNTNDMAIKKFNEFEENGVLVETHKTPVNLVIVGADTSDGGGSRDIAVTDDETTVDIKSGNSKPITFSCEGHISILTLPQYEGWLKHCRDNGMEPADFGIVDAVLLTNFVGDIRVTLKGEDGYINGFHLGDYILHQTEEDVYDVTIELPSGTNLYEIKDHNLTSVLPYIRDGKIDTIVKDTSFADSLLKNVFSDDVFLFAIAEGDDPQYAEPGYGDFTVIINPKDYWDTEACQSDEHISTTCGGTLDLPVEFEELAESTFVYNGTDLEICIKELVQLGLKFDPAFQDFMNQYNPTPKTVNGLTIESYIRQNYPSAIV